MDNAGTHSRDGRPQGTGATVGAPVFGRASLKILGYSAFITVVDAETLAPVWSENRNFDGSSEKWIVNGVHVEQHETGAEPQAKEVVHRFDTAVPADDFNGPLFPFDLKALPLGSVTPASFLPSAIRIIRCAGCLSRWYAVKSAGGSQGNCGRLGGRMPGPDHGHAAVLVQRPAVVSDWMEIFPVPGTLRTVFRNDRLMPVSQIR